MTQHRPAAPSDLARRLVAELVGTALLVAVVVGSGIAAQRLSPGDVGLQLLENSTATVLGLTVLILLFGPVSGAHFNPVVSVADWFLGRPRAGRTRTGLTGRDVAAYAVVQVTGAMAGAELANLMYRVPFGELSTKERAGGALWLAEGVATAGLVALVFALARTGRGMLAAPAVGAYIGAAYWFTSSTSFANPAVTIGRVFSDTFAGIEPASAPGFILAQVAGAAVGVALVAYLYPHVGESAGDVVVPSGRHDDGTDPVPDPATATGVAEEHDERVPQVVYVCRANGGRSAISRLLTEHYAGGRVTALSAGTEPGEHLHPEVARALENLGLDTSREIPKRVTTEMVADSDLAITMGCGDRCPWSPTTEFRDWPLEDPKGQDDATVRRIMADVDTRVRALLVELVPDLELPPSVVGRP